MHRDADAIPPVHSVQSKNQSGFCSVPISESFYLGRLELFST